MTTIWTVTMGDEIQDFASWEDVSNFLNEHDSNHERVVTIVPMQYDTERYSENVITQVLSTGIVFDVSRGGCRKRLYG